MSVGLVSVGGEEGDGGFGCGDDQAPFFRPLRNPFGVGGEGTGGRGDMGAGKGVGKVVSIRGGELWGLWVGGGVEIEEDWRDTGALRDSCMDVSVGGSGVGVSAAGHPTT